MIKKNSTSQGFTLVELVVAVSVFMIFAGGLVTTAVGGHLNSLENAKMLEANYRVVESWEAIKSIRDDDWNSISNGSYGLVVSGGRWQLSGSSDESDGFTRIVQIFDVDRNDDGDIVTSGGEVDDDSKLVGVDISWTPVQGKQRNIYYENYITNYVDAAIWPPEPPPEP